MKTYKAIAYAYPSSPNAEHLGMGKTGAWYVQHTFVGIEGSNQCRTMIAHNCEGFENPDDPDLVSLFHEYEGEIDKCFLEYGNIEAIAAVTA